MPMQTTSPTETIECPLCGGQGELSRAEILDRLGVRDFARVAQLSAEEAFRLLQSKHDREHQSAWSRFETELAKRTAEVRERLSGELPLAAFENRGWLSPPAWAVLTGYYPVRAAYTYIKRHLWQWKLLDRSLDRRGLLLYRLSLKGAERLAWLRRRTSRSNC